ncbi:hypothetical protein ACP0AK_00320 [Listeria ivanovii]|uniref:hypothetical protein n=1 Tax=Listeria ivanovii TaxID=1638 RepID=UPI0002E4A1FB|nr:hypothetical protein [Listeria ivanovii]MBC1759510.1 hypothetical protein [Listeria ivanovii]MBC2256021.1 hypothetical protein [Listeria ivanovii]MBK3915600.1 hypothetical protein [Listeria ivanovii subsp. ivanovii]MBK3922723.1 hypothetical protein [Listeria ivanovii subsp. ivanovii]MBK3927883.1 hypothetical protein [Listeria ivanovii subsp. ivanovii]
MNWKAAIELICVISVVLLWTYLIIIIEILPKGWGVFSLIILSFSLYYFGARKNKTS